MTLSVTLATLLFLVQVFSTFAMSGIIWFVQVVHYPLFAYIPDPQHPSYARHHQSLTAKVVAPLMVGELVTALLLLTKRFQPHSVTTATAAFGVFLLAVIWIATALLQVPLHNRLLSGLELAAVRKLVAGNWIRTISWTLRSLLILYWLVRTA